jgi:hypothetical protein
MPYITRMAAAVAEWLRTQGHEDAAEVLSEFVNSDGIHWGFMRQSNRTKDSGHAPDLRWLMDTNTNGAGVLCLSAVNIQKPQDLWTALTNAAIRLAAELAAGPDGKVKNADLTAAYRALGIRALPGRKPQASRFYFATVTNGAAYKGFKAACTADAELATMPAVFVGNAKPKPSGTLMIKVTAGDYIGWMHSAPNPAVDLPAALEFYGTIMGYSPAPIFWTDDADDRKPHKPTIEFVSAVTAALEQAATDKTGTDG